MSVGEEAGNVIGRPIVQDAAIAVSDLTKKVEDVTAIVHNAAHAEKCRAR